MIDASDRTMSSTSLPARPVRSSPPPPVPPKEHNMSSSTGTHTPKPPNSPEPSKRRLPRFWQQDIPSPNTPKRADDKTPKRSMSLRRRRPSVTPTEASSSANTSKQSLLSKTLPVAPPLRRGSTPLSVQSTSSSSSCLSLDHLAAKNDNVTVHECCTRIAHYCAKLESDDDNVWKHIDSALECIESVLVQTNAYKGLFRRRILELQQQSPGGDVYQVLRDIEKICNAITTTACCATDEFVTLTTQDFVQETSHHVLRFKSGSLPDYAKVWPDHLDRSSAWFRRHFVGKPYTTLIRMTKEDAMIISVVQDIQSNACRVIIRSKDQENAGYYLIGPNQLLEAAGDHHDLLYHRHAVAAARPQLDLNSFKELNAEASIMAGLEKELLRFDELVVPKHYKFGVLNVKEGQTCEEEWFGNSDMSPDFQRFLDLIGNRVELKGYTGYAAGMDTRCGETGEHSYVARWQNRDIMFHVAALMPLRVHDRQQVHRKRHIGNDIVCLVFVDGDGKFDPSGIRSQFLHVFIVVHLDRDDEGNEQWRIQVIRSTNVAAFGPVIPSASQLNSEQLRDFILLKCNVICLYSRNLC
ncbi:hypothetical protein BJV82DRAFT_335108 [Fennellomyces sp. T-0311]|nr:hypothetical protein BJV82DRAFT_335108 [Fennellomyces sp. T-0311]